MLNSKFDIYSPEWIERVFENRNKSYGAYAIRKHYAANVLRALGIAILVLALVFAGSLLLPEDKPTTVSVNQVDVTNQNVHVVAVTQPQVANKPAKTTSSVKKAPAGHNLAPESGLYSAVYQPSVIPAVNVGPQQPVITTPSKQVEFSSSTQPQQTLVLNNDEVDIKPVLPGGAQQWSKFLESNLRYPAEAKKNRISGKVWVSFIVERDGRVSNVTIERGAGHGFDEEALRVLNLSPVWIPGNNNGQAVRVKYILPINFHIEH